jgi:GTP-binding protein
MYDIVNIKVQAGKGGDGAITFRREKFVPFGGPDGGDGGTGGHVVLVADGSITNLKIFTQKATYRAENGGNGSSKKMHGKNGNPLIIKVPVGTTIYEETEDGEKTLLADMENDREETQVAQGGRGGWGNVHFAHSTNQTPRLAQAGDLGEIKSLLLELHMIADVGIIGYPNVGKSSLLAAASAAKPQIANYPFTTREPELGVVHIDYSTFVMAEIPGLIDGASQGKGLGHDFLRHSTRTRIFVHLVDGSSVSPAEDMIKVNNELALYNPGLAKKPQIVVVNKIDLPEVQERKDQITGDFKIIGITPLFISAATGEGVPELLKKVRTMLKQISTIPENHVVKVFYPQPRRPSAAVTRDGSVYVINSPDVERVIARVDLDDPTVKTQVQGYLIRKGVVKILENAGIKGGDRVRSGDIEWYW